MPLIWETIHPNKLGQWMLNQQSGPAPSAYELFERPPVQELLNNPLVAPLKSVLRVHPHSGAVDFDVQALPAGRSEEDVMAFSVAIASVLDPRKAFEWTELDDEERGSPPNVAKAVGREFWLYVDEMRPVGPGGRITYYPRRRVVEIVVRRRGARLGGSWRNSTDVANRVSNYLELDETPGTRLRGGFGYYEASKYERQSLLRPVFLFLLDRPTAAEGPRWRVATTVAATDLPDREATAGIASVTGCA